MKVMSLNTFGEASLGGGAERTMETLLRTFAARGHDVAVLGTGPASGIHRVEAGDIAQWRAGISNFFWPPLGETRPGLVRRLWHLRDVHNMAMGRKLTKVLQAVRPDLVFAHNLAGWSIAAIRAIRAQDIPVIQILHDHYNICVNSTMSRAGKNCDSQCASCAVMRAPHRRITDEVDAVVGVSRYILERHLAHGAYTNVKLRRVIHNIRSGKAIGVAAADQPPGPARPGGAIRFGFIGALSPVKGVGYLLKVFKNWDDPNAVLVVAGTGKSDYEAELKKTFSSDRIKFLGKVTPQAFFSRIDVTIVPSLWREPLGMVVAESFMFGVPVIAARRGGIPEMVEDGATGLIFEPDEPDALLAAMRRCAMSPELVSYMGARAKTASARFLDEDAWFGSYTNLIGEVLAARRTVTSSGGG